MNVENYSYIYIMEINNGQSAAKSLNDKLSQEEGSTTIPSGSTGDNLGKGSYYDNTVKIYTLEHPITGEIRYVGKTNRGLEERLSKHLVTKENNHRANWIRNLLKENLKPVIKLLDEVDKDKWVIFEKYWISQFKTWGFNLVNFTEGGESGVISKKCRDACTKANTGRISSKRGTKLPEDVKKKISLKLAGRKLSKETLRKRSITITGRKLSEENKRKIGLANGIKIDKYDLDGNFIKTYVSIMEASRQNEVCASSIHKCCNNQRSKTRKYKWKYHNKDIV